MFGNPREGRLVSQHLGEDNGGDRLRRSKRGIDWQLRLGNSFACPVFGIYRRAGFVIDDHPPPVGQLIDTVNEHFDANFFDLDHRLLLTGKHQKGNFTLLFQRQPKAEQTL